MKALADYPAEFQTYVRLKMSAPELATIATGLYRNPPNDQAPAELIDFTLAVLFEAWILMQVTEATLEAKDRFGKLQKRPEPPAIGAV